MLGGGASRIPEELLEMMGMGGRPSRCDLPNNASLEILKEIFEQVQDMKKCHDELVGNTNQNNDGEEEDAGNNDMVEDDADENED